MWQTVALVSVAILGVGLYFWYKYSQDSVDALQEAALKKSEETRKALEAELAAKAEQEKKELRDEASKILEITNQELKRRAALDLLKRIRGVN